MNKVIQADQTPGGPKAITVASNNVAAHIEDKAGEPVPGGKELDFLKYLMVGVVLVLFIGFAGMFVAVGQMMIDSLAGKQASYQELEKKVDSQNIEIKGLTEELRKSNEQKTIPKTD